MQEIWKDIQGYEGLYQVSNLGNVKSLKVGRNYLREKSQYKQIILKKKISTSGYYRVELYAPNSRKCYYVHRLVALAFIPNPQNKREVNHIDGNKLNNNVNNLEWVTISENQLHAIKLGLRKASPMKGRKGILSSTARPIIQYTLDGEFVKIWDCASDAGKFLNKNPAGITSCARHESLSAYGYMWRYLDSSPFKLNIEPYKRNAFLRK